MPLCIRATAGSAPDGGGWPVVRVLVTFGLSLLAVAAGSLPARAAEPVVWKLWPDTPPGETGSVGPERYVEPKKPGAADIKRLTDVSVPTLTIYAPTADRRTGTAVIVAPGGGYSILAIEHEGTQVCEWLQSLGVTAALLKYRVPRRPNQSPENLAMLQDAQRAVSLLRSRAAELGIDPQRIGMLGFSAGGHLTASVCLAHKRHYEPVDAADRQPAIPNFALLIYPAWLVDKEGRLKPEFAPAANSPPMFLVHSHDDPISSESSAALYLALKRQNVPAELHIYASGGHGYGMRKVPHPCASWPHRAAEWMADRGYLRPAAGKP